MWSSLLHLQFACIASLLGWWLCWQWGLPTALVVGSLASLFIGGLGFSILSTLAVGRISWKNHLVIRLLPWGYGIASHSALAITAISTVVWLCLVAAGAMACPNSNHESGNSTSPSTWQGLVLLASWLLYGVAIYYLIGQLVRLGKVNSSFSSLGLVTLLLIAIVVASVIGWNWQATSFAISVAVIPLLLAGLGFGMLLAITLVGSRSRWN